MATSLLPFSLCFLLLFLSHVSTAQMGPGGQSARQFGAQSQCRLEKLNALQPTRRVQSEAGFTEYFDQNDDQLQCAGVSVYRRTIETRSLLLASYSNAHRIVYVLQGSCLSSVLVPGCPETYQSFEQGQQKGQKSSDQQHQKIQRFNQGDILVIPAGTVHWCYNDGNTPVVAITVVDTSNNANQLDPRYRKFALAGSRQSGQEAQEESWEDSIFNGFDLDLLAEALGVKKEVARKLQSKKGEIVRVEKGIEVVSPQTSQEEQSEESPNGVEQAFCSMKIRANIDSPSRADVYVSRGGWLTYLSSQKLRILKYIQMSATRGVLHKDAILAPHWIIDAHSLVYITSGRGRLQIVGNKGNCVFDGEVQQGQLVVVPQNFVVVKQAKSERFEWVSFKTNDNAIVSQIVGRGSILGGLPLDVLTNSYPGLSNEEAHMLKSGRRQQVAIFPPRSQQGKADA